MNLIEKATILHYHRYRIEQFRHGTVEALGWRSADSQRLRFQTLMKVGNLNGAKILDIGCGYGDLKAFLDLHFPDFEYTGIDQMPEFIAEARKRYDGYARTNFFQTDFITAELPPVDYVIASGVLGYRCKNENFYTDMIGKLYHSAGIALAFNMLNKSRFPQHDLLIGHNREEILVFCRALSPRVECFNDYLEDDFTVLMYRNAMNDQRNSGTEFR
ncbi:class I SAM-dependent methyltransferase [Nitrosomonas sp.]|uniref:class I SAM-dependent methyltransferase n=1 Tax=Nitrosomonas sp. TaxID=42353 RepID=UPI001D36CB70|nr:class I SAM-dependent methyltransferase [Nitrosomonas sp.]MBX3616322.1 class I SAM-dependent methyltransferase [Nitrosomonas sp.]